MLLKNRLRVWLLAAAVVAASPVVAQQQQNYATDSATIKRIYDNALTSYKSYEDLRFLTKNIGARLSGSPQAAAAVEWSRQVMNEMGLDKVYVQEVMVPYWVRGDKEVARINSSITGPIDANILALGGSVGTGETG